MVQLNTAWLVLPLSTFWSWNMWHYWLQLACQLYMLLASPSKDSVLRAKFRAQVLRRVHGF
jgi:hypothetical protein